MSLEDFQEVASYHAPMLPPHHHLSLSISKSSLWTSEQLLSLVLEHQLPPIDESCGLKISQ